MHFPLGVFGVAVATVTLPVVATYAAKRDTANMLATCGSSLKLVFFLTLPSIFFLALAGRPTIAVLYQHGVFTYQDTLFTSQALLFYSLGLFAYASVRVVAPVFYSVGDTKTPVKVSVLAVAVNILLNLAFMRPLSFRGLAMATSLSAMVNMFVLMSLLRRRIGPLDLRDLVSNFLRTLAAAALMGAVLFMFQTLVPLDLEAASFLSKVSYLVGLFILGAGTFLGVAALMRSRELRLVLDILRRRRQE
jgi:putative peptidoglycan lipid II flippase